MTGAEALDAVWTALQAGRDVPRAVTEVWKVGIAASAVGLALAWRWAPRRLARGLLLVLVVLGGLNYFRWGPQTALARVDTYDLLHYYLNTRYFYELGYYDLYPAFVLADQEAGTRFDGGTRYMAQDEAGHALKPLSHALARGAEVKARFTPERWAAFSREFLYLQREVPGMNDALWRQLLQDHGFNGTPVWTLLASPFATLPVTWIKWLCWLDVVLLGGALVAVGWAFGWEASAWAIVFFCVTYATRWPQLTWAFLRYDYVAGLLLCMALLRRGRATLAGVFLAWSAALRLFPALWLYGPAMQGLARLRSDGPARRQLLALAGGFLLGVAVLQGAAVLAFGPATVTTHLSNMEDHNEAMNLSSRRVGLALALPFVEDVGPTTAPKNLTKETKAKVEAQKPLRFGLAALTMAALAWVLRRRDPVEAYAFGFLPFFLLTTASYYYYVARLTLVVLHAGRLERPRHQVGLAWLLGIEVFCNYAETTWPEHRVYLVGWLAWSLAAYAVVQIAWMAREDDPYRSTA